MTKKHERFKLLLESFIAGLSFPRRPKVLNEVYVRESIFSVVNIILVPIPITPRSVAGSYPQHADIGFHPQAIGNIIPVAAAVGDKFSVIVKMSLVHPQRAAVHVVVSG